MAFPCQIEDASLWFPTTGPAPRAKALCAGCPNRQPCLDFALDNGITEGIFGGTSPAERRAMTKGAPAPVAVTHMERLCETQGCLRPHHAGGLCHTCYVRATRPSRARKAAA
jgi:WhiB family redox-sensing transcriptional regulator